MLLPLGPTITLAALVQSVLGLLPLLPATSATTVAPAGSPNGPPVTAAVGDLAVVVAPLRGDLVVLDRFRPPDRPWLPGHRGVDLAAVPGDPVLAARAGLVLWAGDIAGRGVVSLLHGDGSRTTYEPVAPHVAIGDEVESGGGLGAVSTGASHCGGVPSCLHWGLITPADGYADPLALLGRAGRPRLLPLGAGAVP